MPLSVKKFKGENKLFISIGVLGEFKLKKAILDKNKRKPI